MKNVYLEILKENQLFTLPDSRLREFKFELVPGSALALIGARRVGKTMIAKKIATDLIEQGCPRELIIYINFFDERLGAVEAKDLGLIVEAYYELFPQVHEQRTKHFFFDEIQVVLGWEKFISRLLRDEKNHVYLTGSSAHLLSKEIATEMRGRAISYEIFPLSFLEYLRWRRLKTGLETELETGLEIHSHTARERGLLQAAFQDYLLTGGFPAAFELSQVTTTRLLQEYYSVAVYKDVIERNNASKPLLIDSLAKLLIGQAGSLYTLNRLAGKLNTQGYATRSGEVATFLRWLQDAYLLFSVPIYSESAQKRRVNPQKIYCIDHALVRAISGGISPNSGHLLENIIFLELRRRHTNIFYYQGSGEVDFVFHDALRGLTLIQVCESIDNEATYEREISSLVSASKKLQAKRAVLVTNKEAQTVNNDGQEIEILPFWQFLIETCDEV